MNPTAPDALGTLDVLQSTLERFWPGARTELVRARRDDPAADAEFLLLPGSRAPRLLLPTAPRAAAASVLRFSATAGRREILARALASGALRTGATRLLPERIRLYAAPHPTAPSLADHLAEVLGVASTSFSLGVGPERVNRKPVLQVFGPTGRSLGFAKLGDTDTARTHVRAESEALALLGAASFSTFRVPRTLHVGQWQEMAVLVQEELTVDPVQAARRRPMRPRAAMAELSAAFAEPARPMSHLAWWQRCLDVAGSSPDQLAAGRLRLSMATLAELHREPVPVSAWHGDWTPWNMAPGPRRGGSPQLLVWDWERFETGVPAGLDPLHYAVNTATLAQGRATPSVITRALAGAGAEPVRGTVGFATGAAYLVAVTARYLEMSSAPGGELIADRARAMLETLETWVLVPGSGEL